MNISLSTLYDTTSQKCIPVYDGDDYDDTVESTEPKGMSFAEQLIKKIRNNKRISKQRRTIKNVMLRRKRRPKADVSIFELMRYIHKGKLGGSKRTRKIRKNQNRTKNNKNKHGSKHSNKNGNNHGNKHDSKHGNNRTQRSLRKKGNATRKF